MAVGDLITSTRYNNLQTRINTIMGVGSGQFGYGQSLASAQVITGSQVTLTQILNLRTDMIKARQHQTGLNEGPSSTGGTNAFTLVTTANQITDAYAANLESQMTTIENNKFAVAVNQTSLSTLATSVRTASWNTQLVHEVTLDFSTADSARHYFNAGGTIRVRATLSGGANDSIYNDWLNMLVNAGTVIMDHTSTTRTGTSGTGSSIGFYDLTTANQQIFTKTGSGNYAANDWTIYARKDATGRYVYLRIEFNDDKVSNPNFDEAVTGTLTSIIEANRPSGTNVAVAAPAASTTVGVDSGASVPTYTISSSFTGSEGFTQTWNITTTGVANGTVLYYEISGTANSADWVGGNTGTVIVNSNAATINKTTVEDNIYEPTETFVLTLKLGNSSGAVVATTNQGTILNNQPLGTYWQVYTQDPPSPGEVPADNWSTGVPILVNDFFRNLTAIAYVPPYWASFSPSGFIEADRVLYRRLNKQSYSSTLPSSWWKTPGSAPTFTRDTTRYYAKERVNDSFTEQTSICRITTSWGQQYNNSGGFIFDNSRRQVFFEMIDTRMDSGLTPPGGGGAIYGIESNDDTFLDPGSPVAPLLIQPTALYTPTKPTFGITELSNENPIRSQVHAPWGEDTSSDLGRWLVIDDDNEASLYYSTNANSTTSQGTPIWTLAVKFFSGSVIGPRNRAILYTQPATSSSLSFIVVTSSRYIFTCFGDPRFSANWGNVDLGTSFTRGTSVACSTGSSKVFVIVTSDGRIWRTTDPTAATGWTDVSSSIDWTTPGDFRTLTKVIYSGDTEFIAVGEGAIIRSSDLGLTWKQISGLPSAFFIDVICDRQGKIAIASTTQGQWYVSRKEPD